MDIDVPPDLSFPPVAFLGAEHRAKSPAPTFQESATVPKVAVHEHRDPRGPKDDVWLPGKGLGVEPIAKASLP